MNKRERKKYFKLVLSTLGVIKILGHSLGLDLVRIVIHANWEEKEWDILCTDENLKIGE